MFQLHATVVDDLSEFWAALDGTGAERVSLWILGLFALPLLKLGENTLVEISSSQY